MGTLGFATLLVLLAAPLYADTREVTKITIDGHETIFAEYVQGKNRRTEDLTQDGSRRPVRIWNLERKTAYELDLQSQEYVERRAQSTDWILRLALLIARAPRVHESGKTVNIYYETIDTGERREFFGHTAKHLVMRERHIAEPGGCEQTYQTEKDGWYIPPGEAGAAKGFLYTALASSGVCHDAIVKHGVASLPGIPVLETNGAVTREVLELSNDPLDKTLFEVPDGFRKVDALAGDRSMSWSERLEMEWTQLERAFESWFE